VRGDWAVPQKADTALDRYGRFDEGAALIAFVAGPPSAEHPVSTRRISKALRSDNDQLEKER
jgi:hypothetical protein